jgi:hypothetical protein
MKLQGNVTIQNHLKGSISKEELVAFIRQTVAIPAEASVTFSTSLDNEFVLETLTFDAVWSGSQRGVEYDQPARVMTTVEPASPDAEKQG